MQITGIWLTKNSEKFIGYSVGALIEVLDNIIIVDDNSIDNTKAILSTFGSKIQVLNGCGDMDKNIKQGFCHFTGDVLLILGDDYIWDQQNAVQLRNSCHQGLIMGKRGLRCSVFNLSFRLNQYFSCVNRVFVTFQCYEDPLVCVGSFLTDDLDIVHKSESRFVNGICKSRKLRRRFYLQTGLHFTHWKYLKDTKEYFIHKFLLFRKYGTVTREIAEGEWIKLQKMPTIQYPHKIPEVFYKYADQFVPMGGYDIRNIT